MTIPVQPQVHDWARTDHLDQWDRTGGYWFIGSLVHGSGCLVQGPAHAGGRKHAKHTAVAADAILNTI